MTPCIWHWLHRVTDRGRTQLNKLNADECRQIDTTLLGIKPSGGLLIVLNACDAIWWSNFQPMQVAPTNSSCAIWWPNLLLIQVAPSGGQICNQCKWCHPVAKFATNANCAMLLPNCVLVPESISGSVVPLAMFFFIRGYPDHCVR